MMSLLFLRRVHKHECMVALFLFRGQVFVFDSIIYDVMMWDCSFFKEVNIAFYIDTTSIF